MWYKNKKFFFLFLCLHFNIWQILCLKEKEILQYLNSVRPLALPKCVEDRSLSLVWPSQTLIKAPGGVCSAQYTRHFQTSLSWARMITLTDRSPWDRIFSAMGVQSFILLGEDKRTPASFLTQKESQGVVTPKWWGRDQKKKKKGKTLTLSTYNISP